MTLLTGLFRLQLHIRVKKATDKARLTSKLLQADALNSQLKFQRTRGTKDYLRVVKSNKITSGAFPSKSRCSLAQGTAT